MTVRGQPTSKQDEKWYRAAEELTPQRSLQAAETLANFVFANVAVVGTVLTGFGLVAADGAFLRSAPEVLSVPLPVLLVGLSLALAIVALVPALKRINPADVDAVKRWYTLQILRRGVAVILALLALAGAVVTSTVAAAGDEASDPRISAAWSGAGEQATATIEIEVAGLASSAHATTSIDGVRPGGRRVRLFEARSRADASGKLEVQAALTALGPYRALDTRFSARDGGELVEEASVTLRRP